MVPGLAVFLRSPNGASLKDHGQGTEGHRTNQPTGSAGP